MSRLSLIITLLFFASCQNRTDGVQSQSGADSGGKLITVKNDTVNKPAPPPVYYIWDVDFEKKTMRRNPAVKVDSANVDSVIAGLNQMYNNIPLRKIKIARDTIFMDIKDSRYLTQEMGTNGAGQYLAEAIINLTSVKRIKFVKLDFEEGEHASPGIWSRHDFADFKIMPEQ